MEVKIKHAPPWYLHLATVVQLVCPNNPMSQAGGSFITGRGQTNRDAIVPPGLGGCI